MGVDGAEVRAETSGGSIKVEGRLGGRSTLTSSGGSVTLTVDPDSNLTVDGKGSTVRSDFAELHTKTGRIEGVLGTGADGTVRLRTSGGTVAVVAG